MFCNVEQEKLRSYWLQVAEDIQADHLAGSTKVNYERKWKKYRDWCLKVGYPPNDFNIKQVVSYGAVLRKCDGNSSDTIAGKFAAIMNRWCDLGYQGPPITSYRVVKRFLRGSLRRQGGPFDNGCKGSLYISWS